MTTFSELGLSKALTSVLTDIGFETPTPIQAQAIPLLVGDEAIDLIGLAQTGTGKTAAFALPLLERIDPDNPNVQALIMAPTRELGQQTARQIEQFSAGTKKINTVCVYGGAAISTQIRELKRPTQVVVATPGRLLDLIDRRAIRLDGVQYVVLDEADEMLQMGFKEDIDSILSNTPEERVTWLFSATMPKDIRRIIKRYMKDPQEVSVMTEDKTNKDISHQFVMTRVSNKIPALRRFLDMQPDMRGVMFCRTRRETQEIADQLGELGYGVEALHGELSQAQRDAVMKRFKNRAMQLLVATDVAARGIDVNDLTHVLHHRLPDQLESYTHRSGRTARAGKKGISLAFINSKEQRKIKELEKRLEVTFEQVQVPGIGEIRHVRMKNWAKSLNNVEINPFSEEVLNSLKTELGELTREEILQKLISRELKSLSTEVGGDLNEKNSTEQRDRDANRSHNRYFINVGKMDDISETDLKHFICEVSGVKRKFIEAVSLQKNCAYFDIPKTQDNGFADKFKGIEFDGRDVRVNRDDDGGGSRQGGGGKKFHKKKFGGGGYKGKSSGGYKGKGGFKSGGKKSGGKKKY